MFGAVVELAVVDVHTGATLLDTLVNPGVPIEPGAQAVHGITDADLAGAPTWADVLPKLLQVTEGRTVLAYSADYDRTVIAVSAGAGAGLGTSPSRLAGAASYSLAPTGSAPPDGCPSALDTVPSATPRPYLNF